MAARKCATRALRTLLVEREACTGYGASRWTQGGTRGAHGEAPVAACSGVPGEVLERKVRRRGQTDAAPSVDALGMSGSLSRRRGLQDAPGRARPCTPKVLGDHQKPYSTPD
eukprot:scaffold86_cov338-Pavlova_lutheri.AAC.127